MDHYTVMLQEQMFECQQTQRNKSVSDSSLILVSHDIIYVLLKNKTLYTQLRSKSGIFFSSLF